MLLGGEGWEGLFSPLTSKQVCLESLPHAGVGSGDLSQQGTNLQSSREVAQAFNPGPWEAEACRSSSLGVSRATEINQMKLEILFD